jgi:hypothetical protein
MLKLRGLPVLIIISRITELPNYTPPDNVLLVYKSGATFDTNIISDVFIDRIMGTHVKRFNLTGATVFLDPATCHKSVAVNKKLKQIGVERLMIPPRLTNILQPAGVSWFASIKKKIHAKWSGWYVNGEKTFAKKNNMRSPGYANLVNWISEIWESIDTDLIAKSFEVCGITSNGESLSSILKTVQMKQS